MILLIYILTVIINILLIRQLAIENKIYSLTDLIIAIFLTFLPLANIVSLTIMASETNTINNIDPNKLVRKIFFVDKKWKKK